MISRKEIENRLNCDDLKKRLVIDPFFASLRHDQDRAVSIDFHLGNRFLVPKLRATPEKGVKLGTDYTNYHGIFVSHQREVTLHPGQHMLAVTLEWFKLPNDLMGHVNGRSHWARRGLTISLATAIHPRAFGNLALELYNAGATSISLRPGLAIGQLFFSTVSDVDHHQENDGEHQRYSAMTQPEVRDADLSPTERLFLREQTAITDR